MANLKDIVATLAILGSGTLVVTGCDKGATEAPSADAAPAAPEAEAPAADDATDMADDAMGEEEAPTEGEGEEAAAEGEAAEGEGSCGGAK